MRIGAAAVVFAVQAALNVPAHGATTTPALAGTTVLSGSRSASMAVRLTRPVLFDAYADVDMQARGRLTGFAIKKDGGWDAPSANAIKTGFCGTPGCVPTWPNDSTATVVTPDSNGFRGTLPAGNYRLFLLADGAPVRVTLRLPGLPGRIALTPNTPARTVLLAPKPTVAEPASAPLLYAGGSTWNVGPRGGLNFTVIWKEQPVASEPSAVGPCEYTGMPPTNAGPAFQAPCSNGRYGFPPYVSSNHSDGSAAATPVGPGRYVSFLQVPTVLPAGQFSKGAYHNTAGPVTAAYLHKLWLDF